APRCVGGACLGAPAPNGMSCDDHDACTDADSCQGGTCLGTPHVCDDGVGCTSDTCDPASGCVFTPRASVCSDGDPCTLDVCDPATGCQNPQAPNFSPCGPVDCTSARLCVLGSCSSFSTPDGFPCDDGDRCTSNDACQAGTCAGVPVAREPVVEQRIPSVG